MKTAARVRLAGLAILVSVSLGCASPAPFTSADEPVLSGYDGTTIFRGVFFAQGPAAEEANAGKPSATIAMERARISAQLARLSSHYGQAKLSSSSSATRKVASVVRTHGVELHEASPAERARLVQTVIRRLHASDPTFFRRFGIAMRTGNPGFVERALAEGSARLFAVCAGADHAVADSASLDAIAVDVEKEDPEAAQTAKFVKKKAVKKSKKKVARKKTKAKKKAKKQAKSSGSKSGGKKSGDKQDKQGDNLDKDDKELDDEFSDELDPNDDIDDDDDVDDDDVDDDDVDDDDDDDDDDDGLEPEEDGDDVDDMNDGDEPGDDDGGEEEPGDFDSEGGEGGGDEGGGEGGGDEGGGEGGGDEGGGDGTEFVSAKSAKGASTSPRLGVVVGRAHAGKAATFLSWRFPANATGRAYAKKLAVVLAPK